MGYAARKGRALNATEKGVSLIAIAPPEIASPETTGKWELALDRIAKNQGDTERFMQGIRNLTTFLINYAKDTKVEAAFPEEMRKRGKGSKKGMSSASLPGVKCPLCGKPLQENTKAFGCSAWREGCSFTLWKDGLTRGGGPTLNAKLVTLLLEKGLVKGSTGLIELKNNMISFTPNEAQVPSVQHSINYQKK